MTIRKPINLAIRAGNNAFKTGLSRLVPCDYNGCEILNAAFLKGYDEGAT